MSTTNITAFFAKAESDAAFSGKINTAIAEALATLSIEAGTPFTAEEFLASRTSELSEQELNTVSGGMGAGNLLHKAKWARCD